MDESGAEFVSRLQQESDEGGACLPEPLRVDLQAIADDYRFVLGRALFSHWCGNHRYLRNQNFGIVLGMIEAGRALDALTDKQARDLTEAVTQVPQ